MSNEGFYIKSKLGGISMQKKKMKIIASMLILVLTLAHLNVIGQVLAISLEDQLTTTNNANVEFDSYFKNEIGKEHSATKNISDENYLYTAVNVKNAGYLKDAVVTLENANFEISESLNNKQISKVEANKLYFNKINNGNTVEIAIPIQMPYKEKVALEQFGKESKIKLTATYVDKNGKENQVEKDITIALAWTAEKQAELNMQVTKFIPYEINENKGLLLQTLVQSYLKDNTLPVKENKIEISVPTINGIKPQEVKVLANTTKATNGDETGENFTQENYTYDSENSKLTITVNNELDEKQKISWQKEAQDEFLVTYIYPETEIAEEGVNVAITANSEIQIYEASQTKTTKTFAGEVTLKDQISNLVDFSIVTNIESLSKGQIYANYDAQNKIETEYQENVTANISLANLTDKIILEQKVDNFVLTENTKSPATQTYYKTVTIDQNEFNKILGENGEIKVYLGTTEIAKINEETQPNEQGKLIVDLSEANINNLKIETSKPIAERKLNFTIVKAIKGETEYTKLQMASFNSLEVNVTGKALNGETNFAEQALTKEITLTEPTSQAELIIDNSNLSTVVANENVKITAILKTDTLNCKLYQNPSLQITMPNYIENINIKNIEVLFDTENSKLTLKSHQIVPNADGTKTIIINLEGTQTEYTLGAISKGVNVVITSDITVNKFTANKQDQIKMVYTNDNVISRARTASEANEVATTINVVAPVGVITTSTISNYAENAEDITSISGEEKTATIPILSEARNANLSMEVINNYNNTIDNISILGRTAFKGNKDILSGTDLGTTINMPLASNITVANVDESKVAIYYSENANATKDISLASNAWTLTPTSLENVKSYLIVLTDYEMNTTDKISFNYTMQIPANLQHNESAYENYVVYFNNNLETGTIQDKQASTKVGVTTGKGAVIEASMSSNIAETEEVLTGNIIKYTLTVKNTGTETAENVVATIDLPQGLQHVELAEDSTTDYNVIATQGQTQINLGNIEANRTVTKEILMKVGILPSTEDTKVVEVKATITSNDISLETQPVKNTLARTHFIITPTVLKEREVLRENDSYTYYMEVLSSNIYETKQETVLTIKLPEEIVYESVEIKDKVKNTETDITESTTYNYDSKTRTLTINLQDVDGKNPKAIYLKVKVGTLAEGVYDKQVNIEATVSAKDSRTQSAIIEPVQIGKIGFKITQSSNIPENTHITAGEDLKYIFTIENLSNVDLYNIKFTDILPEELTLNQMKLTRESGNTTNSYKNTMQINLKGREKVTLEVNVSVNIIDETKTVSNKATIEYEGIDTITTSSYKHVIEKFETSDFVDENNDPSNPSSQTKRIMGTIWIDENANGQRDENEEKVPNVEMLLFNNETGKLVTDTTGKVLRTTTNENGEYTFAGISKGKYTVIFLYDTANYSATTYRKENVDASMNSDAVDSKITLDGITRVAAITEEVAVTDSNIYNIDLGLVSNPKFDLKLDKTVSKITVQDATGTNVYEFNDSKLAKKDLVGKQIAGTTIIVEYKIKVTNEGAISGFVKKIADYIPSEMKFNSELNKDWYTSGNGVLYNSSLANTIINPGESKVVTLTLTKKMTEDNLGLYHNEAEIYEAYNDLGIEDIDSTPGNKLSSEDDISSADVLITVKTGEVILFTGLALTIIVTIGIGVYFIKRKVIK